MAFRNLQFAPITARTTNGYPTYGSFVKLDATSGKTNNISVEFTDNTVDETRNADNITETITRVTNYSGTITAYGIEKAAFVSLFNHRQDNNTNLVDEVNKDKTSFCMFFESIETNTGNRTQFYFYDVTLNEPTESYATTEQGTIPQVTFTINGSFLKILNTTSNEIIDTRKSVVFEGATGFVATGDPTTVYTPAFS